MLIPIESWAGFLIPHDIDTVKVLEERTAESKHRNCGWKEENLPRLKKYLENSGYPYLRLKCDEACLVLFLYPVSKKIIFNILQRIGRDPVRCENSFLMKSRELL